MVRYIAFAALTLSLGVNGASGAQKTVKMTFSGTNGPSAINLAQPNSSTAEDNFAGLGTLGAFTFRDVRDISSTPQPSGTCSGPNMAYFSSKTGAGALRFADGSLLTLRLIQGGDCIDFAAFQAHCIVTFQITGGTGRFKDASGMLTLTETVVPLIADTSNNPVFFTSTGEFTGVISTAAVLQEILDERP